MTLSFYDKDWHKALQLCGSKSGRDINKVAATGLSPVELESGAMTFGQARITLDCRKLFKTDMTEAAFLDKEVLKQFYNDRPGGSLHSVYVVEIEHVYSK